MCELRGALAMGGSSAENSRGFPSFWVLNGSRAGDDARQRGVTQWTARKGRSSQCDAVPKRRSPSLSKEKFRKPPPPLPLLYDRGTCSVHGPVTGGARLARPCHWWPRWATPLQGGVSTRAADQGAARPRRSRLSGEPARRGHAVWRGEAASTGAPRVWVPVGQRDQGGRHSPGGGGRALQTHPAGRGVPRPCLFIVCPPARTGNGRRRPPRFARRQEKKGSNRPICGAQRGTPASIRLPGAYPAGSGRCIQMDVSGGGGVAGGRGVGGSAVVRGRPRLPARRGACAGATLTARAAGWAGGNPTRSPPVPRGVRRYGSEKLRARLGVWQARGGSARSPLVVQWGRRRFQMHTIRCARHGCHTMHELRDRRHTMHVSRRQVAAGGRDAHRSWGICLAGTR